MSSLTVSAVVFACVFGGALLGMLLRRMLPSHHLSTDSKDVVMLGMGLVGTLAALVLGLLVASAKGSFDSQSTELTQLAANVVVLDRVLAHYGPEAKEARDLLRAAVAQVIETTWSKNSSSASSPVLPTAGGERMTRSRRSRRRTTPSAPSGRRQ